ncbi:MAG TPA: GNAT family N-acetyltransferase [Nocardioidaceae bacterium]|nr:GNAT family N-acetyltransferase [Nocardioidaceae bacterium]
MSELAEVTVQDNPERRRYEASTESGVVAGFAEYRERDGARVFTHTEVDDAFEGQGIGSSLVRGALEDVRRRGLAARVKCPFIRSYIEKHREYADLLD